AGRIVEARELDSDNVSSVRCSLLRTIPVLAVQLARSRRKRLRSMGSRPWRVLLAGSRGQVSRRTTRSNASEKTDPVVRVDDDQLGKLDWLRRLGQDGLFVSIAGNSPVPSAERHRVSSLGVLHVKLSVPGYPATPTGVAQPMRYAIAALEHRRLVLVWLL